MLLGRGLFLGLWSHCPGRYHFGFGFVFGSGLPGWCAVHWLFFGPPSCSAFSYLSSDMLRLDQRFYLLYQLWGLRPLARYWHYYLQIVLSNLQYSAATPSETVINCSLDCFGSCCIVDCSFFVAHFVAGFGRILRGTLCYDLSQAVVQSI